MKCYSRRRRGGARRRGILVVERLEERMALDASVLYRVNAGGPVVASSPNWSSDIVSAPSTFSNASAAQSLTSSTSAAIDLTHPSIPVGTPPSLFQIDRWDTNQGVEMQWNFPVLPGRYEVRLYFAETYSVTQAIGRRVFDVSIENSLVLDNFDIFAEVGANRGLVKSFTVNADSNIDIDFSRVVENPLIDAIEILFVPTTLYRVNAGGSSIASSPSWSSDIVSAPSAYSNASAAQSLTSSTSVAIDLTHSSIPAGTPQSLFQIDRWDTNQGAEMQWNFPVAPGSYEVRLYFAETYNVTQAVGGRVFDVVVENALALDNFDIFAEVGGNRGLVKSITVNADSNIDIDFTRVVENPLINAIEILTAPGGNSVMTPLFRVNAGGSSIASNPNWISDIVSDPSNYSNAIAAQSLTSSTNQAIDLTHPSIPAGTPEALFKIDRWDTNQGQEMAWNFPVTPGTYEVRLYFAESYIPAQAIGRRVFDVAIENAIVLNNFDIFAEVGANKGLVRSFATVADSNLDIDFSRVVENPLINAIEILSIGAAPINLPPVIAPIDDKSVLVGTSIAVDIDATDPNGNAITLTTNNLPGFATFIDHGDGSGVLEITPNASQVGDYTILITATDNGQPTLTDTESFTVTVKPSTGFETSIFRVNAGGAAIPSSPNWLDDLQAAPSPFSNFAAAQTFTTIVGDVIDLTHPSIPDETPHAIFQSDRFDPPTDAQMQWDFPVTPGAYVVRLYFSETYQPYAIVGARQVDVSIENRLVLDDYDLIADVGNKAVTKSFLVTADSNLDIDFSRVVAEPTIKGIEILSVSTLPTILGASATSLQFVQTPNGSIAQQTITLTNLGSLGSPDIVIDATSMVGASSSSFSDSFDDSTSLTLSPGSSTKLTVHFAPSSSGAKSASLKIAHSGSNSSLVIPLSGQAINETGTSQAFFTIAPTLNGIDGSTQEASSMKLSNQSSGGQRISKLRIDLNTAIYRDMVFDPFGQAGDTLAKGFTIDSDPGTGFAGFNYLNPRDNGFDVLEVDFNNFGSGKTFEFSIDVDPTSIRGNSGTHPAGNVSGLELVGATVSVTFTDGITRTAKPYRAPTSLSASRSIIRSNPGAAPVISIADLTSNPSIVAKAAQTVHVTGTVGATVAVLVTEGRYSTLGLNNGGFDLDPFEVNQLVDVREYFATIGPNGSIDVPVALTRSNPDAAIHSIVAGIQDPDGRMGVLSNVIVVKLLDSLPIGFRKSTLLRTELSSPTSLQFGPDGRLYVAQQDGTIRIYMVDRNNPNSYSVSASESIDLIKSIPNHDDNGTLNPNVLGRSVTGLLVKGTSTNPVIYVASSDPREGGGESGFDSNLDTNSGIVSRLTWTGTQWNNFDIVRGLPHSEINHFTNGLALDSTTNKLLVAQGGNTGMGAPSNNFAFLTEYALSAAILSIDLNAIGSTTYDIPTLNDEDRPGTNDANDPFGGNDGKNQARLVPGGPVQVYAPGFRNAFDLLITETGRLYTVDNGPNAGWGDMPINEGPAGNATNDVHEPGVSYGDSLHFINAPGYYGGHPNPTRSNPNNKFNASNPQSPVSVSNAIESDYRIPGTENSALIVYAYSTNGLTEYTASNFGGAMKGDILSASWSNTIQRVKLNAAGNAVTLAGPLFNNVGIIPLDVIAQGDNDVFPGTIWCVDFVTNSVIVFEPNDFNGAGSGGGTPLDLDGDGYSNNDEIANGTDPRNAADIPPDWDTDFVSNLLDNDDDNDSLLDTLDPFAIDPANGSTTPIGTSYTWENGGSNSGGLLRLGFTGLMTNGTSNYESLFNPATLTSSGAAGVLTLDAVSAGTATGSINTQQQAFQFGVRTSLAVDPFTAHTRIVAPFAGIDLQGSQSMGMHIGSGDQNNFVRIWVTANNGLPAINVGSEINGSFTNGATSLLDLSLQPSIELYLTIDPQTNTVQPSYASAQNGVTSSRILVGAPISIPSSWRTTSARGMAVGIISTTAGTAPSFAASWDFLSVFSEGSSGSPAGESNAASDAPSASLPPPTVSLDVNKDGSVSPLDALIVINELNRRSRMTFDASGEQEPPTWNADVDESGSVEPIDVLLVINYLSKRVIQSEAEDESVEPQRTQPTDLVFQGNLDDILTKKKRS